MSRNCAIQGSYDGMKQAIKYLHAIRVLGGRRLVARSMKLLHSRHTPPVIAYRIYTSKQTGSNRKRGDPVKWTSHNLWNMLLFYSISVYDKTRPLPGVLGPCVHVVAGTNIIIAQHEKHIHRCQNQNTEESPVNRHAMTPVGFEPTQLALVELESTPLDHSGKVS